MVDSLTIMVTILLVVMMVVIVLVRVVTMMAMAASVLRQWVQVDTINLDR